MPGMPVTGSCRCDATKFDCYGRVGQLRPPFHSLMLEQLVRLYHCFPCSLRTKDSGFKHPLLYQLCFLTSIHRYKEEILCNLFTHMTKEKRNLPKLILQQYMYPNTTHFYQTHAFNELENRCYYCMLISQDKSDHKYLATTGNYECIV